MSDTVLDLPTSVHPWGPGGPVIPFPGHPDYVDGTDISPALFWLFTRTAFDGITTTSGIGSTAYAALSGSSPTARTVFRFPAGLTSWIEEGFTLGLALADNSQDEYLPGYNWPKYPAHGWRHIRVISDDPDNRHVLWQADPTNFNDGVLANTVTTVQDSPTAVLGTALSPGEVSRWAAGGGTINTDNNTSVSLFGNVADSTVGSNVILLGTALGGNAIQYATTVQSDDGTMFPGGARGSAIVSINTTTQVIGGKSYVAGKVITLADNALVTGHKAVTFFNPLGSPFPGSSRGFDIIAIAPDRKTLTLEAPALWNRSNVAATVYLPPIRPERNGGVKLLVVDGPGAWGGVERQGYSYDVTVDDIVLRGSNSTDASGIANGREEWIAVNPRRVTGLVLDPFTGDGTNVVYDGQGLTIGENVTIEHSWSDGCYCGGSVENVTFSAKCNGLGRHWLTLQGCLGFRAHRSAGKNTERLGIDCETTGVTVRVLDTQITDCVVAPGTALFHAAPAALNSEPSRAVDGLRTTIGSKLVVCPSDLLQFDDASSLLDHPNLPAGTYVRRRMSATVFEVSQAAIATGTHDGVLGGAALFRDFTIRNVGLAATPGNVVLDCAPPPGRVYFTYLVDVANPHVIYDIQFDERHDGQVFTTADFGTRTVTFGQVNLFPKAQAVASSVTATTATFALAALKSTAGPITFTGTTVAGSRQVATSIGLVNGDVKYHKITAPAGVLREGTTIDNLDGTRVINLNVPAKQSGSFTMTIEGRARGYFPGDLSVRWTGFTFEEIRAMTDSFWGGTGIIPAPANQPIVMAPLRADHVTIRRNFALGLRKNPGNVIARYLAGAYQGTPTPAYGEPDGYDFTIEDNYGPDTATTGMVDNQRSTPTVTVSLVMSVDSSTGTQPTFTVACSRSDAKSMDGYAIILERDGRDIGPALITGNTATFRSEDFSGPLDPGDGPRAFTARWGNSFGGNYETLGARSNTLTIRPDNVTASPTATALVVSPGSPQVEGTTLTLTATVTPDVSVQAGTVSFYDGATLLSTHDVLRGGTAVRVLGTGRPAGSHSFTAVFNGTAGYQTSTSSAVPYTTTAAPTAVNTTTTVHASPATPQEAGTTVTLSVTVTPASGPAVSGGRVNFKDGGALLGNPPVGTTLDVVLDEGTHSFTAEYVGNASWNPSTSSALAFVATAVTDTTPPAVASVTPEDGTEDVDRRTDIVVIFSELVTGPTIAVQTADGLTVPALVASTDGIVWTVSPIAPLPEHQRLQVIVSDAADAAGNVMSRFASSFTTGVDDLVIYPVLVVT
jgi:hypothetical protein